LRELPGQFRIILRAIVADRADIGEDPRRTTHQWNNLALLAQELAKGFIVRRFDAHRNHPGFAGSILLAVGEKAPLRKRDLGLGMRLDRPPRPSSFRRPGRGLLGRRYPS